MKYLLFFLTFSIIGGCGNFILDPDVYTIKEIVDEPVDLVTEDGLRIAIVDNFLANDEIQTLKDTIHRETDYYINCMDENPDTVYAQLRQYKIVVVERTFACFNGQHDGICHGYVSPYYGFIMIAKNRPFTDDDYAL